MTNKRKRIGLAVLCVGTIIALLAIVAVILLQMSPQSCRPAFLTQSLTGELPVPPLQFTGVWRTWCKNGRLASEYMYERGERRGAFTTWYCNGQKAETGSLLKSIPYDDVPGAYENTYDGSLLRWYPDAKPKEKADFSNGVLDGRYEYWDNFDRGYWKRRDENYKDGKEHGVCTRWDPEIKIVSDYKDGNVHGRVRGYADPGGQLIYEYWYRNGMASESFDLKEGASNNSDAGDG